MIRRLTTAYGAAAAWRRRWYTRHPSRRHTLHVPVVSVGNLRAGGTGKTPVVGHIARLLLEAGHRPVVLTRGYARRIARDGVTIVSDGASVLAGLDTAGDEPLMLARMLPGVPVLVGSNRYQSGLFAERHFSPTVHLLDDGFQHFALNRDVDLLLIDEQDLSDAPFPAGRLRERLAAAMWADAALVTAGYDSAAGRIGRAIGVETVFRVSRVISSPRVVWDGDSVVVPPDARVFAVAGIARPERFFSDVSNAGWNLVGTMVFRDHYRFGPRDVERIAAAARTAAAAIVLTTEKDAVRLAASDARGLPVAFVPLVVAVEPADAFRAWLVDRLRIAAGER